MVGHTEPLRDLLVRTGTNPMVEHLTLPQAVPITEQDLEFPQAWRPKQGEYLIGKVVSLDERDGEYGSYPIVTVQRLNGDPEGFPQTRANTAGDSASRAIERPANTRVKIHATAMIARTA